MPVGSIGVGIANAFADYLNQERMRRRQEEDAGLDRQMQLIQTLASNPNVDPSMLGGAIHDLAGLSAAKSSPRKGKGGQGFLGSSDPSQLPISQLLTGIGNGSIPMQGTLQEPPLSGPPATIGSNPTPRVTPKEGLAGMASMATPPPPPAGMGPADGTNLADAGRQLAQTQGAPAIMPQGLPIPPQTPPPTAPQGVSSAPSMGMGTGLPAPPQIATHGMFLPPTYGAQMKAYETGQNARAQAAGALSGRLDVINNDPNLSGPDRSRIASHIGYGMPYGVENTEWLPDPKDPTRLQGWNKNSVTAERTPLVNTDGSQASKVNTAVVGKAPASVQMAIQQMFGPGKDYTMLEPNQLQQLHQFVMSRDFEEFARKAGYRSDLEVARAWVTPHPIQTVDAAGRPVTEFATASGGGAPATTTPPIPAPPSVPGASPASPGASPNLGTPPATPRGASPVKPKGATNNPVTFPKLTAEDQQLATTIRDAAPMIADVDKALSDLQQKVGNLPGGMGSVLHAAGQGMRYYGHMQPSDPVYQTLIPLTSFLRVFMSKPYMSGSRNFRLFEAIRDHIPSFLDSPQLIQDKLNIIKRNMSGMATEMGVTAPPVYGQSGLTPPPSSNISTPSTGGAKIATQDDIQKYAQEHNVDAATAESEARRAGYTIQR